MSNYRKFAISFFLFEIVVLAIAVWVSTGRYDREQIKQYNVDISRIVNRMESGEALSDISLEEYDSILSAGIFDPNHVYANEYAVKKVGEQLYFFEYQRERDDQVTNGLLGIMAIFIFASGVLLVYIDRKVLTPFSKMDRLTSELAKGNLATPIQQEKSKYFGKFLWGMDMLRETLEDNKKRELDLLKEKKTLVLSLSHDIKTPLSAIDLYAKALQRDLYQTKEQKDEAYAGISNNVSEIKRYVDEIEKASREDFLMLETNNGEIYLRGVLDKISVYYAEKLERLRIDFAMDEVENCLIFADEDRLTEVMQNCMENAIKYGDGKRIHISFEEEENCKLITLSNSGCTLSEDELPHLFDSFYRGSNSEKQEGSGLGLYICKQLMHKMDGEIFAQIKDHEFRITLVIKKVM